jgi:hypothetical protein
VSEQATDKTLGRIRALLAKAEDRASTPEEAELYFAKAAELMARHGVDRAMLAASDPDSDVLGDRIVVIEGSYHVDKQRFLAGIAKELGCRAVLRMRHVNGVKQYSVHLFGFDSDLERVEILYTSLLVQALNTMAKTPVPSGENTRTFRISWWAGFRMAVTRRLHDAETRARTEVSQQREQAGTIGPSVALVLADRSTAVSTRMTQQYPKLRTGPTRWIRGSGYGQGHDAGRRADLGGARMTFGRRRALGA